MRKPGPSLETLDFDFLTTPELDTVEFVTGGGVGMKENIHVFYPLLLSSQSHFFLLFSSFHSNKSTKTTTRAI